MSVKTYTVDEVAKMLDCTERTIRNYIKAGKIKAVKMGRKYIISEDNYKKFINGED
ncbi:helix-turn-helix domain-containing protein [Macrococcoides caseolyticum]|uniref:helix-turn-helix domain-containing protein n=1 Tax=Macrococcoides caseolyticum TaxID=69966 RepID=UPI000C323540|nr:helix-turn-helix domain-containing protein [Macrococcus caseolyticus]PKE20732.1 DNA-binding protein [Macrococcus caseolyticus]PKE71379.1 DNA-binding protein [Macrococcus caseolyticus]PKF05332.1 DNA-binding protein [Macrococcus caseolyticus]